MKGSKPMFRKLLTDKSKRKQVQEYAEVALAVWTLAAFAANRMGKKKSVE